MMCVCPLRPRVDLSSLQSSPALDVTTKRVFIAVIGGGRGRRGVSSRVSQQKCKRVFVCVCVCVCEAVDRRINQRCLIKRKTAGSHLAPKRKKAIPPHVDWVSFNSQASSDLCT